MRIGAVAAAFVMVLATIPPVESHGSNLSHVQPMSWTVQPGERTSVGIEYEEGDLRADWVFLLNAVAKGNRLQFTLRGYTTNLVAAWDLPGDGQTHFLTGRIRKTEIHGLEVFNPGPNPSNLTMFYDASCNCAGKPIPPDVPKGAVFFNVDVQDRDIMRSTFPEPDALKLRVSRAIRVNDTAVWPKDFRILEVSTTARKQSDGELAHVFDWTADRTGRFYFFVEAVQYDETKFDPTLGDLAILAVYVQPDNVRVGKADAPGPTGWLVLAALAAGLAVSRRSRRT